MSIHSFETVMASVAGMEDELDLVVSKVVRQIREAQGLYGDKKAKGSLTLKIDLSMLHDGLMAVHYKVDAKYPIDRNAGMVHTSTSGGIRKVDEFPEIEALRLAGKKVPEEDAA